MCFLSWALAFAWLCGAHGAKRTRAGLLRGRHEIEELSEQFG